ncbi:MAG: histidine kinase [Deltaproteobacteria bacterium]|nr:histidine kinase [Deltaproteobacteria bacterium]
MLFEDTGVGEIVVVGKVKHRVLVVDDYPDSAEIACTLLGILGHDTRLATCGREAIEEATQFDPDIVILDIGLPDITGYDVARTLRARGRPMHLTALTGWGQAADRMRAFAAGFDQFVLKPTDAAKLRAIVQIAEDCRARRRCP